MNDSLARDFVNHLESDLLKAKHLLQSGLDNALDHLRSTASGVTGAMSTVAAGKLKALEIEGEASIDEVERRLGELNYLAAEGDIKSGADFAALAEPLSEALQHCRSKLAKIDEAGQRELGDEAGVVAAAWRDLHIALDAVSLNLTLAAKESAEEAEILRQKLTEEYENAAELAKTTQSGSALNRLQAFLKDQASHVGNGLKAFFIIHD